MSATPQEVQHCINTIAPFAIEQYKKGKLIFPSVCIAQACNESAYLTATKMRRANAVFGIKVGKSKVHFGTAWKDKAYSTQTKECYDGKTFVNIQDMFRAYDSIQESVEDYYDMMMKCSRYKAAVGAKSPQETITAIKSAGYATDPAYISIIMSIIKKNDLTRFDNAESATITPAAKPIAKPTSSYIIGKTYTLQSNLYVRVTANGSKKAFAALTANAKANAKKDASGYAILNKGTKVTCKSVVIKDGGTWIQIPSGWVCAVSSEGKIYIS